MAFRSAILTCGCVCLGLTACRSDRNGQSGGVVAHDRTLTQTSEWFVDATAQTGLDFTHVNGMTGQFYYPEVIAPGVALFDFDNDGDLDVFLVQGGSFQETTSSPISAGSRGGRLYRNDLDV